MIRGVSGVACPVGSQYAVQVNASTYRMHSVAWAALPRSMAVASPSNHATGGSPSGVGPCTSTMHPGPNVAGAQSLNSGGQSPNVHILRLGENAMPGA